MRKTKEKQYQKSDTVNIKQNKGYISINWGRQGGVILAYIAVLLGFYGIIANLVMVGEYGRWISYLDPRMDRTILIWPYKTYLQTFFLPVLFLFLICFLLTYKEDIPLYGIKASIWMVPVIVVEGFIFYWLMFGLSIDPFLLQFTRVEGYLNVFLLFIVCFSGSFIGMKIKQIVSKKKEL
ncbi:hypothetical protein LCGC14_1639210 [marine sediment metagenome]|uniref:Uncharacterized protein n=1 Tax=marine sediment metagenome TaxID=412755 RepID=A0A0F9IMP4_9ZZZZ